MATFISKAYSVDIRLKKNEEIRIGENFEIIFSKT